MTVFSAILFITLGGLKLRGDKIEVEKAEKLNKDQIITLVSIFILVVWVIFGGVNVGFAAFVLSSILIILKVADQNEAIKHVPWSTLILISGTAVLINVIKELGGVDLLADFLAKLMNEQTAISIMAVLAGMMSIFSSAVGVVMPTLIPTTVELSNNLMNVVTPTALTITIAVASHIVTMSPFSTMGALALASSDETVDKKALFKNLFITAFSSLAFIAIFLGGLVAMGIIK